MPLRTWGERTGFHGEDQWPERVDEMLSEEPERWVQSACVLCSNGCALDMGVKGHRIVGVRGRAADRVNRGRLGPVDARARPAARAQPTPHDRYRHTSEPDGT
jgi:anaerobic selenocysteine-containing dehydrogenase